MSEGPDKALGDSLLQMVNNPELSDVILACKDGVHVHACRMLLAARSAFFKEMLLDGMTEGFKPRGEFVELPTVTSSVLVIILKFLYSEVLLDDDILKAKSIGCNDGVPMSCDYEVFYFRLDWEFLLKVVTATRFLRIERQPNAAAGTLSTLCEYHTLWNAGKMKLIGDTGIICSGSTHVESIEDICFQLMKILAFYELSATTQVSLSRKAFHFYLSKRQKAFGDETWDRYIEEYLRLREIITWCAVQVLHGEADLQDLHRTCLPGPEIALTFLEDCVRHYHLPNVRFDIFSDGRESFVRRIVKDDLKEFLPMVSLAFIEPELLVNIIEPLGLIEHADLSKIYSVQAMRGSRRLRENAMDKLPNVWNWVGSGLYSLDTPFSDNLTFTVSVETSSYEKLCLVAAAELQLHFGRKYEWEIVIMPKGVFEFDHTVDVIEIGFYQFRHGESFRQMVKHPASCLSYDRRSSALSILYGEADFHEKGALKHPLGLVPGSPRTLPYRPLKVMLNRVVGICTFSSAATGGHTFPIQNAADEVFYPAVYIRRTWLLLILLCLLCERERTMIG